MSTVGFHEVSFPLTGSYSSSGGPGFSTNVVETDSGQVSVVRRWSTPRHLFDVSGTVRTYTDLATLKTFYMARGGPANGFRYKDPLDCTSHPTAPGITGTQGTEDQIIASGDGATTIFQLKKTYTSGGTTSTRFITKPISGTTHVWLDHVTTNAFTVNTATGQITFTSAPGVGVLITASFDFETPVQFSKDLDRELAISAEDFSSGGISSISLIEIINPALPYTSDFFYGGGSTLSISASATLNLAQGRFQRITATTTSLVLTLPNPTSPTTLVAGGPYVVIQNGGSNTFTLKDHTGATLVPLTAGSAAEVWLSTQSGGTLTWVCI